ncbi:MAG TPA: ATP-dependent helicase C-terminal domain-containing protein [Verrucomicrobiae bacterium]|nr:ATP-dependent helicase C-terminal domain-containing protein [Verrucomicrobiae bacterium]
MNSSLPIWQIHSEIVDTLRTGNRLVLVAPTGSGKTTQVPQMIRDAGLAGEKKIVILQPRRVAARTVAARVAWERGGHPGDEVGYQIRFDDRTGPATRICFVTEGVLLRWLQEDRTLADTGVILFDEFHERNLLSDVALAWVKQLQQTRRADLKMAVMSATLDARPVAAYLGNCPMLVSEGQSFPVEVHYLDQKDERPATEQAADTVERVVNAGEPGDVLVFMPGMGEINATMGAVRAARLKERVDCIPLHGDLPPEDQDRAFAPSPVRKVVVATNVAETSVTIDGIRHVVDSGLARVARYDAERGISTLFIEEISRASTDQRKGRAGRTAPGTCYRLWTESGQLNRPERNTPEIQRSDLAEVVLLLHSLGIRRAAEFDWLDKPDPQAVDRAERLLQTLGAIRSVPLHVSSGHPGRSQPEPGNPSLEGSSSDLTAIGRQMLRLPMHPRYSRMLVEAANRGCIPAAALCAALVSGRDLLARLGRDDKHIAEARELFEASQESDFFTLMRAYQFAANRNFGVEQCRRYGINAKVAREVKQTFEQILEIAEKQRAAGRPAPDAEAGKQDAEEGSKTEDGRNPGVAPVVPPPEDALLRCITAGFIDQLSARRSQGTFECELTEGRQGTLMRESVVQNASLFVAATIREVTGRGSENLTLLGLATAVKREWIEEMFPDQVTAQVEHLFDRTHKRVAAVKLVRFHDLVIHHEHQSRDGGMDPAAAGRCLAEAYGKGWFELPLFNHELKQFIARTNLVCAALPGLEFPAFDDAAVTDCLARAFRGLTLAKEAQATHLRDEFQKHLAKEQLGWLDELAPLTVPWPDGRKLKLLYPDSVRDEGGEPNPPELQVKLHECFALREHPHICEGKQPVKLWLCAPDGKRLEATFNWPAFKTNSYPRLRSALQKKYPGVGWI